MSWITIFLINGKIVKKQHANINSAIDEFFEHDKCVLLCNDKIIIYNDRMLYLSYGGVDESKPEPR